MARKYTFHRDNCDCIIREIYVDIYGRTIIYSGKHAFEYYISVVSITNVITTTKYKNGSEARKAFYKYKRKNSL